MYIPFTLNGSKFTLTGCTMVNLQRQDCYRLGIFYCKSDALDHVASESDNSTIHGFFLSTPSYGKLQIPEPAQLSRIIAKGASGGKGANYEHGSSHGAVIRAIAELYKGQYILALVGQHGTDSCKKSLCFAHILDVLHGSKKVWVGKAD
ncbi:unnamed protein product [Timema podura]|uniref:Uncharacterized protein n=1 Tax=Timema podura TaxID=61482 RepID=A0ABN7P1T2_TIMPD|nr:unnamed protein product [Timema podura]